MENIDLQYGGIRGAPSIMMDSSRYIDEEITPKLVVTNPTSQALIYNIKLNIATPTPVEWDWYSIEIGSGFSNTLTSQAAIISVLGMYDINLIWQKAGDSAWTVWKIGNMLIISRLLDVVSDIEIVNLVWA